MRGDEISDDAKVGMNPGWAQREAEREAHFRRQFALEQAVKVVTNEMDWSEGGSREEVGARVLSVADRFANWVESGTLPQA